MCIRDSFGGVTLGGKIAPIFFNTQEDSGALPIEVDVSQMNMGDVVDIYPSVSYTHLDVYKRQSSSCANCVEIKPSKDLANESAFCAAAKNSILLDCLV